MLNLPLAGHHPPHVVPAPRHKRVRPAHFTPVPNALMDDLMAYLCGAELRVALYVARRTVGFGKLWDGISLKQFLSGITTRAGRVLDNGCGLRDRSSLIAAVRSLEAKGVILCERRKAAHGGDLATRYRLGTALLERGGVGFPDREGVGFADPQKGKEDQKKDLALSSVSSAIHSDSFAGEQNTESPEPPHSLPLPSVPVPPPPTSETPDPVRATLARFAADFGTEFRDGAPVTATTTRLVNTFNRSGLPLPRFVDAMYSARQTTRERLPAIKARDAHGQATAVSYWCAVVEERAGLRPPPERPERQPTPAPFPSGLSVSSIANDGACDRAEREALRAVMIARLRDEFGIPDVAAFCKEFGRPPYFGEVERTVSFVRAMRRKR